MVNACLQRHYGCVAVIPRSLSPKKESQDQALQVCSPLLSANIPTTSSGTNVSWEASAVSVSSCVWTATGVLTHLLSAFTENYWVTRGRAPLSSLLHSLQQSETRAFVFRFARRSTCVCNVLLAYCVAQRCRWFLRYILERVALRRSGKSEGPIAQQSRLASLPGKRCWELSTCLGLWRQGAWHATVRLKMTHARMLNTGGP